MQGFFFLAVMSSLSYAPAPEMADLAKQDLGKMQGEWEILSVECQESPLPTNHLRLVICENGLKMDSDTSNGRWVTITLNARARPKTIDLALLTGEGTASGVYEVQGNTLKLCFTVGGFPRPKKISTSNRDEVAVHGVCFAGV
jgi:uncharacterized protein (TIGR03067 family)